MTKRRDIKATSRTPLRAIPDSALARVTAGTDSSIDPPGPVAQMREIVHIQ